MALFSIHGWETTDLECWLYPTAITTLWQFFCQCPEETPLQHRRQLRGWELPHSQSHNHMPCFMLWVEPIFIRTGSFISLSLCLFHWASLCSCQWFPFVLRQDICVSQAGHLTCYVAQAGSKSWSSYLSQVLGLQVYTIIPMPLNLNSIRERMCVPFPHLAHCITKLKSRPGSSPRSTHSTVK